jgi:hypothetical protein
MNSELRRSPWQGEEHSRPSPLEPLELRSATTFVSGDRSNRSSPPHWSSRWSSSLVIGQTKADLGNPLKVGDHEVGHQVLLSRVLGSSPR